MKKLIAMALSALLLTGCGASPAASYESVDAAAAAARMAELEQYVILDVRTPAEYASGHIPGAVNLPNETIGTERPAALPEQDQAIFVYCRSGNRSKQASRKLAELGYTQVVEFGGINTWTGELVTD